MNINFREVELKDKEFILNANKEINILSGLNDSTFDNNIDNDLFKDKICKVIIAEDNNVTIGFILYSYLLGKLWKRNILISSLCKKRL